MKKSFLLEKLFSGYEYNSEINSLKESILSEEKQNKSDDINEFAKKIKSEYPQFEIIHQAFIRNRVDKICSAVVTIKIIVIIAFVASIIAGLIVFFTLI